MNKSKGKATPKSSTSVVVYENKQANKNNNTSSRRKNKRPNRSKKSSLGMSMKPKNNRTSIVSNYYKSLVDPFNYSGVKLGWGCLVNSTLTTIYLRSSTTANADGTLSLAVYPNAKGTVSVAAGAAVSFATTASKADSADQAAITANFGQARVVSIGIRAYPNLAATSAPGVVCAGAITGSNFTLMEALTTNDLQAFPTSRSGPGIAGACATGRPQDVDSFNFTPAVVNGTGFAGTQDFPCSIPYIAFSGIGNGTVVFFEVAINIEAIQILQHSSAGIATEANTTTLADYYPSIESMYNTIRGILPSPSTIGTVIGSASAAALDYLTEGAINGRGRSLTTRSDQFLALK